MLRRPLIVSWLHRLVVSLVSLVTARILYGLLNTGETYAAFEASDWFRYLVGTLFLIAALSPIALVYIVSLNSRSASLLGAIVLLVGLPTIHGIVARSDSSTAGLGLITLPYIIILPALLVILTIGAAIRRKSSSRLYGVHSSRRTP